MPHITRFLFSLILVSACLRIALGGETVTVKSKIEKIDLADRTIIVATPDSDEKIDLELTRKTKIKRGKEVVGPDAIKAGDSATINYDSELMAALSIEIGATVGPTEALNLEELNSPELDISPWVSSDGLEIFWATEDSGKNQGIWAARRKNSDGFFEGKKRLFSGHAPVLSSDGLQMFFRNSDAETISLATRKSREEDFGRPRPVPDLTFPGMDAAPRWLTHDGLTLYLDLLEKNGRHYCGEAKRKSLKSNWMKPAKTEATFEGMPSKFRFVQVSATQDNLHLYCVADFLNQNDQLVFRAGILSRKEPNGPFTEWAELPLTGPNGMYPLCLKPQFVAATKELFLTSNSFYSDPQGVMKRRFDLWVIKDFQQPTEMIEVIGQSPATAKSLEILNLDEINSPANDVNPSLTSDGLSIVWQSGIGDETFIYEATRTAPEALFSERKKLFAGFNPVIASDGQSILFYNPTSKSVSESRRIADSKDFGRPLTASGLEMVAYPTGITEDGLTLYLDIHPPQKDDGHSPAHVTTRAKRTDKWRKPVPVKVVLRDKPFRHRVMAVCPVPGDESAVTCNLIVQSNKESEEENRPVIMVRSEPIGPFLETEALVIPKPTGEPGRFFSPRYIPATRELVFQSNQHFADSEIGKKGVDLWLAREFEVNGVGAKPSKDAK